MNTYQVTVVGKGSQLIEADRVIRGPHWLIFRVRAQNVGRFPAETTTYREVQISDSSEPTTEKR